MNNAVNDVLAPAVSALFPSRCSLCGDVVFRGDKYCDECENALRPKGELCSKCGLPKEDCECDDKKFRYDYSAFAAPFYFRSSIAKGIIRFKNYGYTELADAYADEIAACVTERFADVSFDCVTYIPITKMRKFKRGYNQSQLLAEAVAKRLKLPSEPLLIKTRSTKSQRSITARERRVNLHGAFDLAFGADTDGKSILLVDDIKTTGSTLSECALTLRAYGAKEVYATAIAVVDENKR